jgi:hypothetical protein
MWKKTLKALAVVVALVLLVWLVVAIRAGIPAEDEAKAAGIPVEFFRQAPDEADHFAEMDGGITLTLADVDLKAQVVRGRNTWMIWTGGNEAFWDWLANNSLGTFDLLKTLSSYPCSAEQEARARRYEASAAPGQYGSGGAYGASYTESRTAEADQHYAGGHDYAGYAGACADTMYPPEGQPPYRYYSRDTRFCYLGLTNEPGFRKATRPDEFGLCLDEPTGPPEPFDKQVYGRPTGVLGLRLYPNPDFDEKARKRWMEAMQEDAFYLDGRFYTDRKLVRPYRVGMACSFCHVSPHPNHPPEDPENPEHRHLSGTIAAQYFWFGRIFAANVTPDNFVWHLVNDSRPGAIDTSFIPADNLNNPRAVNAVFNLPARLAIGDQIAQETSAGGALGLPDVAAQKDNGYTFGVPHVLWDGADSVGIDAALTRVYINIGEYHQEWVRHISPILGVGTQSPIKVEDAQNHSVYWNATQERSRDLATYLIHAGYPMPLAATPGGPAYLQGERPAEEYEPLLSRGKVVFAETCARCHSSKLPQPIVGLGDKGCVGAGYLDCWNRYWAWTETAEFKQRMTELVFQPDFLDSNYLSTDARIPVTLLETEICSSMASNAVEGHVWDNFASQSYKDLPAVGTVTLEDPVGGGSFEWPTPAGGRGYQRVPSLVSIWSTAPFLHNNEVGRFTGDPSLVGRMDAFDDSVRKLLWPETREGIVRRTDRKTDLKVSTGALPWWAGAGARLFGLVEEDPHTGADMVAVGPIPRGTPVSLLANLNLDFADPRVSRLGFARTGLKITKSLKRIHKENLSDQQAAELLAQLVPDLLAASACPDFTVDRGHPFGSELPDTDKEALIEFLKTL